MLLPGAACQLPLAGMRSALCVERCGPRVTGTRWCLPPAWPARSARQREPSSLQPHRSSIAGQRGCGSLWFASAAPSANGEIPQRIMGLAGQRYGADDSGRRQAERTCRAVDHRMIQNLLQNWGRSSWYVRLLFAVCCKLSGPTCACRACACVWAVCSSDSPLAQMSANHA